MRVHELAKELDLSSAELRELAERVGVDAPSNMSSIDEADADKIRKAARRGTRTGRLPGMNNSWIILGLALIGGAAGAAAGAASTMSSAEDKRDDLLAEFDKACPPQETNEKGEDVATDPCKYDKVVEAAKGDPTALGPFTYLSFIIGVTGVLGGIVAAYLDSPAVAAALAALGGGALLAGAICGVYVDAAHEATLKRMAAEDAELKEALKKRSRYAPSRAAARMRAAAFA